MFRYMPFFLCIACSPSHAEDTQRRAQPVLAVSDTASIPDTSLPVDQVIQEAAVAVQQSRVQEDRAEAIVRYLEDQLAVKHGKAPKGWVQPPFEEYCKPGAPTSFIPVQTTATAPVSKQNK